MCLRKSLCAPCRSESGAAKRVLDFRAGSRPEEKHPAFRIHLPHRQPQPAGGILRKSTVRPALLKEAYGLVAVNTFPSRAQISCVTYRPESADGGSPPPV